MLVLLGMIWPVRATTCKTGKIENGQNSETNVKEMQENATELFPTRSISTKAKTKLGISFGFLLFPAERERATQPQPFLFPGVFSPEPMLSFCLFCFLLIKR
jgi:hypothetical protein